MPLYNGYFYPGIGRGQDAAPAILSNFIFVAKQALNKNDVCFIKNDGAYKASDTSLSCSYSIAINITATNENEETTLVFIPGTIVFGYENLVPGSRYYLSSTPGSIAQFPSQASGSMVYKIGFAKSETELVLDPDFVVLI